MYISVIVLPSKNSLQFILFLSFIGTWFRSEHMENCWNCSHRYCRSKSSWTSSKYYVLLGDILTCCLLYLKIILFLSCMAYISTLNSAWSLGLGLCSKDQRIGEKLICFLCRLHLCTSDPFKKSQCPWDIWRFVFIGWVGGGTIFYKRILFWASLNNVGP